MRDRDEIREELWIPADRYDKSEALAALDDGRHALTIACDFVAWWFAPGQGQATTESADDPER